MAALIQDLKERGLFDDTLVIWGGEFGRTGLLAGKTDGQRLWSRSPSSLFHALAGWGRDQRRRDARRDRRIQLQRRP
jgi:Protein of unknown function (DUF1501)